MPTMGEKLWEVAKSPPQNMTFLVFGLFAVLAGFLLRSWSAFLGAGSTAAVIFAAAALAGIGAFFVAVSLFLGAFAGLGDSDHVAVRIAALIGGLVVLIILL
jgi:hypothetical protein